MGAWGPEIFDDDVALDVKNMFEEDLANGLSATDASQHVLNNPPWGFDDEEDTATTVLALAALQMEYHVLSQSVKERAIDVIDSGVPLWRWEGLPDDRMASRIAVLQSLKQQLLDVTPIV